MTRPQWEPPDAAEVRQIRSLARPLLGVGDLDRVVDRLGRDHFVGLGEASHGTHEFYRWRAGLSRRLIMEHGFTCIGVEGDWPDCWRISRWVRGQEHQQLSAGQLLAGSGSTASTSTRCGTPSA
jgi:erythromycin esterase-like protein